MSIINQVLDQLIGQFLSAHDGVSVTCTVIQSRSQISIKIIFQLIPTLSRNKNINFSQSLRASEKLKNYKAFKEMTILRFS